MANDKSGKQFPSFINARNKRKHDKYELDDIEDTTFFPPASADGEIAEQIVSVTAQALADTVKERATRVLEKKEVSSIYFGTVVTITGVKLNSKNT